MGTHLPLRSDASGGQNIRGVPVGPVSDPDESGYHRVYFQSNPYSSLRRASIVPELGDGLLGCFRCGYVWRLRKAPVWMCPRCKSHLWNEARVGRPSARGRRPGLGIDEVIGPQRRALKALAEKYGGFDLRVFGSVARGEADADSDLDLLVRFRRPVGLLGRSELKERFETLLGRTVDLATEANLHWLVRPRVMAEAVLL